MAEQRYSTGTATMTRSAESIRGTSAAGMSKVSATGATGGSDSRGAVEGTASKPVPFAAVSFVCGLVGLLVANLLLGPLAVILGAIGLRADANRRGRAALGMLLGVADIAVFLFLAVHAGAHHGSISWNFLGH